MSGGKFGPKLDDGQVAEIVARFRAGSTLVELADDFGVTTGAISYHLRVRGIRRDDQPGTEPAPGLAGLAALIAAVVPGDWVDEALCAQTDPEAFFPEKGGSTREAKAVCRSCPVRPECLEFAVESGERFGIWGGASERERRRLEGPYRRDGAA